MYSKKLNVPMVVLGVLIAAIGITLPAMLVLSAPPIGIIGGADGPTYWFLLGNGCYHIPAFLITIGFAVFVVGLYGLFLGKALTRYSSPMFTLLSFGISIVIAGGTVFFLEFMTVTAFSNEIYQQPIAFSVSAIGSFLAFVGFVVLTAFYCKYRKEKMSIKGILLDILLVVLTILPLFFTACYFGEFVGYLI